MSKHIIDRALWRFAVVLAALLGGLTPVKAQTLEEQLAAQTPESLVEQARREGDAGRGAIVFYQPHLACVKCHDPNQETETYGPALTKRGEDTTDVYLVESILHPSQVIKQGYQPISLLTVQGKVITGLSVPGDDETVFTLRDASRDFATITVPRDDVEEVIPNKTSIMPTGQVNQLSSKQQFLDLVRYLIEVRDGGAAKARELQPPASMFVLKLPEYESHVDHAGLIRDLDEGAFTRGEAIYQRLCINCHGTLEAPGSLPTALRFGEGQFKNGNDPFSMYRTLTRGFGFMVPQTWMVPSQKYDVIHYIREAYLRAHNSSQHFHVTPEYLAGLPAGDTRGPEPTLFEPWVNMDYGPTLTATYEVGDDGTNFAHKGIAVRLDPGPGGVSRGNAWMLFDHDTLRVAAGWTRGPGENTPVFIDWQAILFNGRHQVHPRVVGDVHFANPTGPGWADPETGSFVDDTRVLGRDGKRYGPLPHRWAKFQGYYAHADKTILSYSVGRTPVLEMPGLHRTLSLPQSTETSETSPPVLTRALNLGSRPRELTLLVATRPDLASHVNIDGPVARLLPNTDAANVSQSVAWDGATYAELTPAGQFDMTNADFTIAARIRTTDGGTIFCKTKSERRWKPDGKSLFVRNGRLCYDIGWVGAVQSKRKVNDGRWHDVAVVWQQASGLVRLIVDGKTEGTRKLRPQEPQRTQVVRIGYTNVDFPEKQSFFIGDLRNVRFYQRALSIEELAVGTPVRPTDASLLAHWPGDSTEKLQLVDVGGNRHHAAVHQTREQINNRATLLAGLSASAPGCRWMTQDDRLCLRIPAGDERLKLTVWMTSLPEDQSADALAAKLADVDMTVDLAELTGGAPARWNQTLETVVQFGSDESPFTADALTVPTVNPWLARVRLTGFDFYPDGDRMAVCAWDGDVWLVSGLARLREKRTPENPPKLKWQRIASGLFQPLGLKLVDGEMFVTCRDQLVRLHDLNGDGEIDFYECFNDDHQVTEHFHEFAMGLQTDDEGNFYYAKSARHALPAIVPHHGTLLRISADGARTDILATGFRAANGVCVNGDGTFIVTDQQGHWMPENRVNWVRPGGFYGNMFGYHDVTDSSDDAMEQPLCWINNLLDRSPSELLWVDSPAWGPLRGSLLNLSYGYGKVYVVPHENLQGQMQGGMCELPIAQFPTGTMRGRFSPHDGQLYTCGMFAWASNQQEAEGGLYRLSYNNRPAHLPIGLHATAHGMRITWSDPLDAASAVDAGNYRVETWNVKRTEQYGSDRYDLHQLQVTDVRVSADRKTIELRIPEIKPTWSMSVRCSFRTEQGEPIQRLIFNTIHHLPR